MTSTDSTDTIDLTPTDNCTPASRGKRLRRIRNMTNESRRVFAEGAGVSVNTLKCWELGAICGISKDGCKKTVEYAIKKGILCSIEWLLYEIGFPPVYITDNEENRDGTTNSKNTVILSDDDIIFNELINFTNHYHEVMQLKITDDSMSPNFVRGDIVAGPKVTPDKLHLLAGYSCIIQLDTGEELLRNLIWDQHTKLFSLVPLNFHAKTENLLIHNPSVVSIAPVTRVYKPTPKF